MKLSVVCETCVVEVASCESSDPTELRLLLLAAHAAPPHNAPHRLKALIDGAEPHSGTHEYIFECILPTCGASQKSYRYSGISSVDASMYIVVVHGEHEGHPLKITRDGTVMHVSEIRL